MSAEKLSKAMTIRSVRTIKSELEFLVDASAITPQQLQSILAQLPSEATSCSTNRDVTTDSKAAPAVEFGSMNLNGAVNEKKSNLYNSSSPPAVAPPPAYPNPPPQTLPPTLCYSLALYQYDPTDTGDITLLPNDRVAVTEYMNAEWWKGRNERTGQEGIFPRNYVRVDEKGLAAPLTSQQSQPTNYGNVPMDVIQSGSGQSKEHTQPSQVSEAGKKFGKKLGNATIFGAGATIGSNIVNGIF